MSRLASLVDEGLVETDVPLGPLTTYKSGGPASYFSVVHDDAALLAVTSAAAGERIPLLVLGRGSNLVVSDRGFDGLVVKLGKEFSTVAVEGTEVTAGGGASLARVARSSVEAGLTGLEFLVGVPGSMGGAVRQNAGCFGSETVDVLIEARVLDVENGNLTSEDGASLELGYRHSSLKPSQVVVLARLSGARGDEESARAELRRITRWRRDNQPGGTLNAGSVFKNPPDVAAGELIDSLGLKGMRVGDVSVSEKHANFFVAGPSATSADIRRLVEEVKDRVFELSGTILEPEIQFVGFDE